MICGTCGCGSLHGKRIGNHRIPPGAFYKASTHQELWHGAGSESQGEGAECPLVWQVPGAICSPTAQRQWELSLFIPPMTWLRPLREDVLGTYGMVKSRAPVCWMQQCPHSEPAPATRTVSFQTALGRGEGRAGCCAGRC